MIVKQKIQVCMALGLLMFSQFAYAFDSLDTQIGQEGMSVHLIKLNVGNGVLTASVLFDNDTDKSFYMERPDINEIHYVAGTKKYPVLKDANGDWLASPVHDKDKLYEIGGVREGLVNKWNELKQKCLN